MAPDRTSAKQRLLPNQQSQLEDLPDFLHNSPFLPLSHPNIDVLATKPPRPKPTLKQILHSKPIRTTAAIVIFLTGFLALRSTLRNIDILSPILSLKCINLSATEPPLNYNATSIDWSKFAYTQYVTNTEYLCNSLMIFESLQRLGSRADRIMMYPRSFSLKGPETTEARQLRKARDEYGVKMVPVDIQRVNTQYRLWADSYTKLLAFNLTSYSRILLLDSDSTLLQPMDELFLLPPNPVALPLAYWLSKPQLTSHIMLITPSSHSFTRVKNAIKNARQGEYDMEIVNNLFERRCIRIPHRRYALLTGEFRAQTHGRYLGEGEWDPEEVINEAKFVHFSDHPFPKPWYKASEEEWEKAKPRCVVGGDGREDCRARDVWVQLYEDFRRRREGIC